MSLAHRLRERLSIDRASLAAFRWGLLAIVILDLSLRLPLSSWLLSPQGMLQLHPEESWGLLRLGDFEGAHFWLFALAGGSAVLVALEKLPRLAAAVLLVSVGSVQARNPWILDGGDGCLRWLTFWNFLLSLELCGTPSKEASCASGAPSPREDRFFAFSGAGLLLQPVVLYLSSVAHKLKGVAWRDGTAVEVALSQSLWERPLGVWIAETDSLSGLLTYLTLVIELVGPVLLIFPYRPALARWVGLALLTALQFGIALSLRMNLFPWIMTLALVPFVPAPTWARRLLVRRENATPRRLRFANVISQLVLVQALLAVTDSILGGRLLPPPVQRLQVALGIEQNWSMYSPNPYHFDFGLQVMAVTSDGEKRLLDPGLREHPFSPLNTLWADYRGGIYLENVASPDWPEELSGLCGWIARQHEIQGLSGLREISLALLEWPRAHPEMATRTELAVWRSPSATGVTARSHDAR